jgi:hypothetical protein
VKTYTEAHITVGDDITVRLLVDAASEPLCIQATTMTVHDGAVTSKATVDFDSINDAEQFITQVRSAVAEWRVRQDFGIGHQELLSATADHLQARGFTADEIAHLRGQA